MVNLAQAREELFKNCHFSFRDLRDLCLEHIKSSFLLLDENLTRDVETAQIN